MTTGEMGSDISRDMYAKTIGKLVLDYADTFQSFELLSTVESEALKLISEIRGVLNDDSLEDPECFRRIEALVKAFDERGIDTSRHDW